MSRLSNVRAVCVYTVLLMLVMCTAYPGQASATHSDIWLPPLGEPLRISAPFHLPNGPYRAGHRGIDLPATLGQTIQAPASGVISFAGMVVDRPVLSLRVDAHTVVSFEAIHTDLARGDPVERGQIIGRVAAEKQCAASCLHLGVRVDGNYVNPLKFFAPRPRLIPWNDP